MLQNITILNLQKILFRTASFTIIIKHLNILNSFENVRLKYQFEPGRYRNDLIVISWIYSFSESAMQNLSLNHFKASPKPQTKTPNKNTKQKKQKKKQSRTLHIATFNSLFLKGCKKTQKQISFQNFTQKKKPFF